MWIYSPFINKSEQILVQIFFLSSQLRENKLSQKKKKSLDTDYAQNDIHMSFVLEFEWEII